jgi:hypothetical protein
MLPLDKFYSPLNTLSTAESWALVNSVGLCRSHIILYSKPALIYKNPHRDDDVLIHLHNIHGTTSKKDDEEVDDVKSCSDSWK